MSCPTTELAHLFRALKAPAAARALPKLADRARQEEWSYEQFAATLLKTEIDSRDSHGGQARIKAARFPARKTIEEFDFAFQTSLAATPCCTSPSSTSWPARRTSCCWARPAPARRTSRSPWASAPASPASASLFRTATEWVALLADAGRHGRLDTELDKLQRVPLLIVDEVGYIPFDPQAANLMFMLVSRRYERASLMSPATSRSAPGANLRRRGHRHRHDRPPRPPRRDPQPQGRQLPPQIPRPARTPTTPTDSPRATSAARLALRARLRAARPDPARGVNFQPAPEGRFSSGLD